MIVLESLGAKLVRVHAPLLAAPPIGYAAAMRNRVSLLIWLVAAHLTVIGCGARTPLGQAFFAGDAGVGSGLGVDASQGIDTGFGSVDLQIIGLDAPTFGHDVSVVGTDVQIAGVDLGSDLVVASDGTSAGDGATGGPDAGSCVDPSVAGAPMVPIVTGPVTPAGMGGTLTSGTWFLQSATLQAQIPIPFMGTVQSALLIDATNATSGTAALHLAGTVSAIGMTIPFDLGAVGDYTIMGDAIDIAPSACGGTPPIEMAQYTIEADGSLTLYGTLNVMGFPIAIQSSYVKQ